MADLLPPEMRQRTLAHYADKFATHGDTPKGVDWNGSESQQLHFDQLWKLLPPGGAFSINDFGCGYGALVNPLLERFPQARYHGIDLNAAMIDTARQRHGSRPGVTFEVADQPSTSADFGVASGVFTLRLGRSDTQCAADMHLAIDALAATSLSGFAFNCLTSYSDVERMRAELYYPDPCAVFDHCKRRHARNVALLHDYGLHAFTILVRKDGRAPT